ncbi:MAG: STAS domain-containing protein [Spirochaetales bacterium]|nr:STAS domain-containing protein [Spirochaetales bacterium]
MEKGDQPEMTVSEKDPSITIIETVEDLDLYSSVKLKEHFNSLREAGWSKFIVDLAKTRYLDSSGLGALIHIHSCTKKDKDAIIRFANISPSIFQVIKLTHLEGMFHITPDVETAVSQIKEIAPESEVLPSYSITDIVAQVTDIMTPEKTATTTDSKKGPEIRQIEIDDEHELFDKSGLEYKRFFLSPDKIRRASSFLACTMPIYFGEINQLEQQSHELLKNAVKHGNKGKMWKPIKVWYSTCTNYAHIIIEDTGKGFREIEEWNEFYRQRMLCCHHRDYKRLLHFLSFRTEISDKTDTGTAFFSAIEYWNKGIVFNEKRNAVAVKRMF